jgi:hypothetical protein
VIGSGVTMGKFSHGGVRTSRFAASAKQGNNFSGGNGSQSSVENSRKHRLVNFSAGVAKQKTTTPVHRTNERAGKMDANLCIQNSTASELYGLIRIRRL